ncbi:unnamed protein product [Notodromas monacha]|uniref:EF-hand domain-containing protein n=1 Tax=Notodromas monacha TaxID=399045 RepID=A0A7R9BEQ3_9CRUS|nr:unnamed protein product [Notodromas monacha]CAG0913128.1 unnamed protein product [Notodromas monacha]
MANPAAGMPDPRFLADVFRRVDRDNSGAISAEELRSALSNGTWTPFSAETVRLMINMFDHDRSGTVNFNEFSALWKYVVDWQACFRSFDRDNSGNIDGAELRHALTTFGYRFQDSFVDVLVSKFDRQGRRVIFFDDFIQCCVMLHILTAAFRQHDTDLDGVVTITYEQFLMMCMMESERRWFDVALWTFNLGNLLILIGFMGFKSQGGLQFLRLIAAMGFGLLAAKSWIMNEPGEYLINTLWCVAFALINPLPTSDGRINRE